MKILKLFGLLFLLPSVTACGYLFGDSGLFRDSAGDYREAREMSSISLPDGVSSDEFVDIYPIPEIESDPQFGDPNKVPRPAPLVSASADQLVRIQKLGEDTWALVAIAPGQLWPQLRSFLSAANIDVARMDARAGIIESTYLVLEEDPRPTRFRFRVERGVQRGNSELHVLQMFQTSDGDTWPAQSDDFNLESELLRGVAQYVANSADTAPVSMMAEQSISAGGKVSLGDDDQGSFILLELPFDRAWASIARSLDLSGFDITDRNRSEGRYYLRYVGDEDEEGSGWFAWLGDDDDHPADGVPLILDVEAQAPQRMMIRMSYEEGGASLTREQIEALLVLVKGNIN
ncbi:outer membrane protein assembly factor BamC [Congregibacter variabilis]|uniref:Outer membrane protein assembly factor BamC n=1 Tax=Congregibacter variabilis TaxID=3081200 RepID=A0ABZ0I310_9GAMM|nr:outer membrane protein assembly factor BamC [Congregibacter sp. IMCC43200]